uniref:Uncharacterized protein n=1 Tax=Manihot esculenta TaxID=3983 RepID=A0A2C9U2V2_MANES
MGCFGKRNSEKKQNPYQTPAGATNPPRQPHYGGARKGKSHSKHSHGVGAVTAGVTAAVVASSAASSGAGACGGGGCAV